MIVATGSIEGFFHGVVTESIRAKGVEATEGATSYLVSLLTDFARPGARAEETLARPLAFLLDEAMATIGAAERFERFRSLGDGVLYTSGFFGDHFASRGVDQGYLIGIGTVAYSGASAMLRIPDDEPPNIYRELADKFASFVAVLADIADATLAHVGGSNDLLKMYERWLKTGSERLAQALASHGLLPTRGPKGGVLQ